MKISILLLLFIGLNNMVFSQDFTWAADFEGDNSWVTAMTVDSDGNTYTAIVITETVDFDPGPANYPVTGWVEGITVIQKLDVNGNFIWAKEFVESGDGDGIIGNGMEVQSIAIDATGNILLTGNTSGRIDYDPGDEEYYADEIGSIYYDIFILKLNEEGELDWVQTLGGDCADKGIDIQTDYAGDIVVTGTFCLTVDFNDDIEIDELTAGGVEGSDVFVLKLTESGEFIWVRSVESDFFDEVFDLEIDKNNNLFIGGFYTNSADFNVGDDEYILTSEGVQESFLLKLDATGTYDWVITISGPSYGKVTSISLDSEGDIYTTGSFSGEDIDFDPGVGEFNLSAVGQSDLFITKYATTGDLIWAKKIGGELSDRNALIEISAINTVYITGNYGADIDVDPSGAEYILEHTTGDGDNYDMFIATLSQEGEFIQGQAFNGDRNDYCIDLQRGPEGSVYLAGTAHSEIDLDLSAEEFMVYGDNYEPTAYVLKLQDGNVGIEATSLASNIALYPNPTQGDIVLNLNEPLANVKVSVIDQTGRVVQTQNYNSAAVIQLNIDGPTGIYFVKLNSDDKEAVLKVVKSN